MIRCAGEAEAEREREKERDAERNPDNEKNPSLTVQKTYASKIKQKCNRECDAPHTRTLSSSAALCSSSGAIARCSNASFSEPLVAHASALIPPPAFVDILYIYRPCSRSQQSNRKCRMKKESLCLYPCTQQQQDRRHRRTESRYPFSQLHRKLF